MDKTLKKYLKANSNHDDKMIKNTIKKSIDDMEKTIKLSCKLNFETEEIQKLYKQQYKGFRKLYSNNKDKYYVILYYSIMMKNYFKEMKNYQEKNKDEKIDHKDNIDKLRMLIQEAAKDIRENINEQQLFMKTINYLQYLENPNKYKNTEEKLKEKINNTEKEQDEEETENVVEEKKEELLNE
jgi:hypothetical protein